MAELMVTQINEPKGTGEWLFILLVLFLLFVFWVYYDNENKKHNKKDKKRFLKNISKYFKYIVVFSVILTLALPFCIPLFADTLLWRFLCEQFSIPTEINTIKEWFSFFTDYIGIVLSLIVSILTIYLTLVLDELNSQNADAESRLSNTTKIPNMECKNISLYSIENLDTRFDYFNLFETRRDYVLHFNLQPAFPPYFDIVIKSIEINLHYLNKKEEKQKNQNSEQILKDNRENRHSLSKDDYVIANNSNFDCVINIPLQLNDLASFLYKQKSFNYETITQDKSVSEIKLRFQCSNVLLENNLGDLQFDLVFQVECEPQKSGTEGVSLKVLNRQFKRVGEENNGNESNK